MKSSGFGIVKKKTPFQKHKEAEEEKRRKQEAEAAAVYEEFVESFASDDPKRAGSAGPQGGGGGFVRGGTILPGQKPDEAPAVPASAKKPQRYTPAFLPPSSDKPKPKAFEDDEPDEVPLFQPKKVEKDKPRQIDLMLERLKQEQQERDERDKAKREGRLDYEPAPSFAELGMLPGSFDSGDPFTTNLYVGNLAPDVDEQILIKEFGRFGAIGSVKVMWPRDEEQRRKGRNCGFVAFMRRDDAAKAMDAMDGIILHDFELRIGWGKAMTLPSVPCWPGPGAGAVLPTSTPAGPSTGFSAPHGGAGAAIPPPGVAAAMPWSTGHERRVAERSVHDGVGPDIEVPIIEDLRQRFILDSLALYVQRDGCAFEQLVMEEEQNTPEYAFLFNLECPEHIYYRWRVYSLAEGDTLRTWRIEPFIMVEGGQRWIPPSMTALAVAAGTAAAKGGVTTGGTHHHERPLSDKERDRFEDMLRSLTVERADIKTAMIFALDCADAGADVVETLADALTLPETPVPSKIARLFLVSDILHNCTAPVRNASRYRGRFEAVLPAIFESLQETYRAVETRITQESLRRHVLRVLRCWRERYVFSDDYLNGLQATFLQPTTNTPEALAAAHPTKAAELNALTPEELDRKCRTNGLSTKGDRDACITRLLALESYLNAGPEGKGTGPTPLNAPLFPPPPAEPLGAAATAQTAAAEVPVPEAAAPVPVAEPKPVVALVNRWTTIDEEQEEKPQLPISKWLQQEAEAEALRQQAAAAVAAAAAAAAAEADKPLFEDVDSDDDRRARSTGIEGAPSSSVPDGMPVATPGGGSSADDEKRRQRLRQVELQCARLEAELEEHGLGKEAVAERVAAKRTELVAEMERVEAEDKAAALGKWRARREASGSLASGSGRDDRDRDKDRDRERDRDDRGGSRREGSRSERDRERRRSRSRSRSREKRSADRDRDRDRVRDKDRERDREKEKEKERGRDERKDRDDKERRDRSKRSRSRSRSRDRDKKSARQ